MSLETQENHRNEELTMMMIFPRQRVNLFLATFIAGLSGGALGIGLVSADNPTFALMLGAAVTLCGVVQIYQELTQPPVPGSSDLLLGAGQLVGGVALMLFSDHGSGFVDPAVRALTIFYALTVLQLAANLRQAHKKIALIFAVAGAVPFVMAVVPFVLPFSIGLAPTLYAACAALVIAAVVVTFLLPFEEQKAKEQAEKLAAAEKKAAQPAPKPLTPEEIAAKEEAARLKAEKAAKEAEARKAAEEARRAKQAAEDAEAEKEAMSLLTGLGGLAGKAKKKVTSTAKNTVDGFKQGLNGQDGTGK